MIIINFKSYRQSAGKKGLQLAKICQQVMERTGVKIIPCLQTADIGLASQQLSLPVWAQYFSLKEPDRNTGWVTAHSLAQAGAEGVLINHSEHPFKKINHIEKAVSLAKKEGLKTLVFVSSLEIAQKVDQFKPDFLALEEPTMVAGKVAMAQVPKLRKLIKDFCQAVSSLPIVGAGINNKEDIVNSLKLGARGVALASSFIKADQPEKVLLALASAFK